MTSPRNLDVKAVDSLLPIHPTGSAKKPPPQDAIVRNQNLSFIINEILVEAAGVELFSVLITRKLLIPGIATTAKKDPLPNPLYVYCTKMLFAVGVEQTPHGGHSIA